MSRKSTYTEEMAEEICGWIAEGKPLRVFCRQEGKPAWRTVYDWQNEHPEFAARIARAREMGHDAIAEEALEIANTPLEGTRTTIKENGIEETKEDMLGHRRLQIETRLKLLAKWNPRKYGERQQVEHSGELSLSVSDRMREILERSAQ